ncbi:hypothetical protein EDD21DRAFT_411928 [Dissophora ornata]|nr:hypothetical protein EDD21DRAFT_411928 [Dissophora ornata]
MADTQSFRLIGQLDIEKIPLSNINGQNIVYWSDIQQIFPGVKHLKNGDVAVTMMRDSQENIIKPDRIKHCPNVVLEVVLSTAVKHVHVDSPMSTTNPGLDDTVLHKLDGLYDQGHVTQEIVKQVLKDAQDIKDRLILIQSKTEAILTQNYELLEYTIPRLFIILPEKLTPWDPKTMLRTKFRLHFICECGEHTKAPGSKIPHHLHLANHEGYVVNKPTEFFKKYGPFLTLMLEMIKVGTSIAGHVVPPLASLKVVDILDSAQSTIDSVTSKVIEGVDYSLKYLEESRTLIQKSDGVDVDDNARMSQQDLATYFAGVEGLEGVDLRQLGSYLSANSSDNLLGNLYRMTTKDGYVKWVCRHHYRAGYQQAHTQKLRDVVMLAQGVFDEQLGSIKVTLKSSFAAAEFYEALSKAKAGVCDLDITFNWDCSRSDLEAFEKALKMSSVSILRLDLHRFQASIASNMFSISTRYEILVRIIEHANMKMIHIVLSKDFVKLSILQPKRSTHLQKLSLEITPQASDFRVLVKSLKTNNPLTTLNFKDNSIGKEGALALSGALKTNTTLTTLNFYHNSIGNEGALALSEALKTNTTLTTLKLQFNSIEKEGALALSEALKTNTTLTTLNLFDNSINYEGAQALSEALKINTTLTTLNLGANAIGPRGALALSEALKTNTTLTTLILYCNTIWNEGALALSEALKTNTTLTTLNLMETDIGDGEGALALTNVSKASRCNIAT